MSGEGRYWLPSIDALPRAEAGELARLAESGDASARWRFVASVAPLIRKLAYQAGSRVGRAHLIDDMTSAGIAEVWANVQKYDASRGTPGVFAERVAWHGFRDVLGDLAYPCRLPVGLVEPVAGGAENRRGTPALLESFRVATAEPEGFGPVPWWLDFAGEGDGQDEGPALVERDDLLVRICGLRNLLNRRERRALALLFRVGLTKRNAGKLMGLSGERVRQIEAEAIGKLRAALGAEMVGCGS